VVTRMFIDWKKITAGVKRMIEIFMTQIVKEHIRVPAGSSPQTITLTRGDIFGQSESICYDRGRYLSDACCSALNLISPSPRSRSVWLSSNNSQRFDSRDGHACVQNRCRWYPTQRTESRRAETWWQSWYNWMDPRASASEQRKPRPKNIKPHIVCECNIK